MADLETSHATIDHTGLTGVGGSADLAGEELDYVQITSAASITGTSEGGATTVITGTSIALDGSTTILVEVDAPYWRPDGTNSGDNISLWLFDGATHLGRLKFFRQRSTGFFEVPLHAEIRLTPSNASHQYIVKASVNAGTGSIGAGPGGSGGDDVPAFLRITRV